MNKKDVYIYYSSATDVTGKKLQEALEISGGKDAPPKTAQMVIGWGTKTDKNIELNNVVVLNHPNSIKNNRNKVNALASMHDGGVSVAPFVMADLVIASLDDTTSSITLPLIGRTKFHQGGKGFWMCPTKSHVTAAIGDGAQYFQNMLEIATEFRVHVVADTVIYAVKKVKRTKEEFETAFIEDEMARQKKIAETNNDKLDEETMKIFLRRQAKNASAGGANMMVRSNKMGWKFSRLKTVDPKIEDVAVKAVKALGLSFGAVDCCFDSQGVPYVIEVNTGPGLEASTFDEYVTMFKKIIDDTIKASKTAAEEKVKKIIIEKTTPVEEVIIKPIKKKIDTAATTIASEASVISGQLSRLQKELEVCNDPTELAALKRLCSKIIFGGE